MRQPDPFADLFARLAKAKPPAQRPHITLSYAQSLDGSIAAGDGQPLALSSPEALLITHRLRAAHDGILIGIGTVLADNPRLTVRLPASDGFDVSGVIASPQPVVLDARLRFPPAAALLDHPCAPWIAVDQALATSSKARILAGRGVRLLPLPMDGQGYLSLPDLLAELAALGMHRLMVEGGAQVISSFLRVPLVDLLVLTITPHLVGGLHGLHLAGAALERLPRLQAARWQAAGPDRIVWGAL